MRGDGFDEEKRKSLRVMKLRIKGDKHRRFIYARLLFVNASELTPSEGLLQVA